MKKLLIALALLVSGVVNAAEAPAKVVLTKDNTLVINDYFYGQSVANLSQQAKELDAKMPAQDPLYLVINSGGGSIEAGIELIENLNRLNRPVHTVSIFAASMGFQTVNGVNGKRLVQKEGTLMSHKARGMFYGEFPGQLDSRYSHYLRRVQNLDKQVVSRTNGKHTLETYSKLIENEFWCDGADCIAQGLADEVVEASCDTSMTGTKEVLWDRFIYFGHVIEIVDTYSECPLITYELSYQIYIDGEPLFETYKNNSTENEADESLEDLYRRRLSTRNAVLSNLGEETAENIKKLVEGKMSSRIAPSVAKREIRKY